MSKTLKEAIAERKAWQARFKKRATVGLRKTIKLPVRHISLRQGKNGLLLSVEKLLDKPPAVATG